MVKFRGEVPIVAPVRSGAEIGILVNVIALTPLHVAEMADGRRARIEFLFLGAVHLMGFANTTKCAYGAGNEMVGVLIQFCLEGIEINDKVDRFIDRFAQ